MLTSTIPYCSNTNPSSVTSPFCYTFAVVDLKFSMKEMHSINNKKCPQFFVYLTVTIFCYKLYCTMFIF